MYSTTVCRLITRPSIASSLAHRVPSRSLIAAAHPGPGHSGSHASDNDPEVLEAAKEDLIRQYKEKGIGEWKEELASDAEAVVKADRANVPDDFEKLQEESMEKLSKKTRG